MIFGCKVTINKKLRREYPNGKAIWTPYEIIPTECLFIGYRLLSQGIFHTSNPMSDPCEYERWYEPTEHIKVMLVIPTDGKRNPFYSEIKDG